MRLMGKGQIAVVAALVALAFSAGLAQSGLARVNELPQTTRGAAVEPDQDPTGFAHRGPFGGGGQLAVAAGYIGISEQELRTGLEAGKSLAQIAVEKGKSRDGLIAALTAAATEKIGQLVDRKGPFGPGPGAPGKQLRVGDALLGAASDYLGIAREDLVRRVRAGETLAEIANATAGKSRDGLVAAIVAASNAKIDQALSSGRITAEQAAKMRGSAEEMAGRLVDADAPFGKGDLRKGGPPAPRGS